MPKVYNLYGLAAGEDREYMETLLLSEGTMDQVERVIPMAKKDGFHTLRTIEFFMRKPDFVGTINNINLNKDEVILIKEALTEYWHNQIKFSKNENVKTTVRCLKEDFKNRVVLFK